MSNQLFFGDNLEVLREHVQDESVDLVYLDPPFNSKTQYNVIFKSSIEDRATAQVEAFRDTWSWGEEAQEGFEELLAGGGDVARIISALHGVMQESDMMAKVEEGWQPLPAL